MEVKVKFALDCLFSSSDTQWSQSSGNSESRAEGLRWPVGARSSAVDREPAGDSRAVARRWCECQ